jgi:hypothetical protein
MSSKGSQGFDGVDGIDRVDGVDGHHLTLTKPGPISKDIGAAARRVTG